MQKKRIQNKISESRWTTSFVLPISFLVWTLAAYRNITVILPTVCMLLSTFLMMRLNHNNGLIRIYSRMVSCSFLVLATLDATRFTSLSQAVVMLGGVGFFSSAFMAYQKSVSAGYIFYAFVCFGISSIIWTQVIFFLPILWIIMSANLLAMSGRNFVASILGLLAPYWFLLIYLGITNNLKWFVAHFNKLLEFSQPFNFSAIPIHQALSLGFIILCSIIGIVHYLRQRRNDSIRTRLFCQAFINGDIAAIVFLLLQPQHANYIQSILIVCTSPLLGHFCALTKTRFTNWIFCTLGISCIIITLYNIWIF